MRCGGYIIFPVNARRMMKITAMTNPMRAMNAIPRLVIFTITLKSLQTGFLETTRTLFDEDMKSDIFSAKDMKITKEQKKIKKNTFSKIKNSETRFVPKKIHSKK